MELDNSNNKPKTKENTIITIADSPGETFIQLLSLSNSESTSAATFASSDWMF